MVAMPSLCRNPARTFDWTLGIANTICLFGRQIRTPVCWLPYIDAAASFVPPSTKGLVRKLSQTTLVQSSLPNQRSRDVNPVHGEYLELVGQRASLIFGGRPTFGVSNGIPGLPDFLTTSEYYDTSC